MIKKHLRASFTCSCREGLAGQSLEEVLAWTKMKKDHEPQWTRMPFTTYQCSSLPSHHCFQAPLFLLFPSSRRTRVVSHQAAWKWNWSENLTICVHPDLIFSAVFSTWSLSKLFTRKQTLVEGWSLNSTFRRLTLTPPHSPRTRSIWRWKNHQSRCCW